MRWTINIESKDYMSFQSILLEVAKQSKFNAINTIFVYQIFDSSSDQTYSSDMGVFKRGKDSYEFPYLPLQERNKLLTILNSEKGKLEILLNDLKNLKESSTPLKDFPEEYSLSYKKKSFAVIKIESETGVPFEIKVNIKGADYENQMWPIYIDNLIGDYKRELRTIKKENGNDEIASNHQILKELIYRSHVFDAICLLLKDKNAESLYYYDEGKYAPIEQTVWDKEENILALLADSHIFYHSKVVPVFMKKAQAKSFLREIAKEMQVNLLDCLCKKVYSVLGYSPSTPLEKLLWLCRDSGIDMSKPKKDILCTIESLARENGYKIIKKRGNGKGHDIQKELRDFLNKDPEGLYISDNDLEQCIYKVLLPTHRRVNQKKPLR